MPAGTPLLQAGYGPDGLRDWKQTGAGGKTFFLYDGGQPVVETDAAGNLTAVNTFGPNGLLSRQAGGAEAYYEFDPMGNVQSRLGAGPALLSSDLYTAFGNEIAGNTTDVFGYGGQWGYYRDSLSGQAPLYLLGHREYDPSRGRFLTRDPIGYSGGQNLYAFAGNNPVNAADPDGTSWLGDEANGAALALANGAAAVGNWIAGEVWGGASRLAGPGGHTNLNDLEKNPCYGQLVQPAARTVRDVVAKPGVTAAFFAFLGAAAKALSEAGGAGGSGVTVGTGKSWTSPAGLIYETGSAQGNRVLHLFEHLGANAAKVTHSVFNVDTSADLLDVLDEAWSKRGDVEADDPGAYVVPMGRAVGTHGENAIRIIVRPGTSRIITAYPVKVP